MPEKTVTRTQAKELVKQFKIGVAIDLTQALQRRCPVKTGRLKNSIKWRIKGKVIEIYMPMYGYWLDVGTLPHIIEAKDAQALHWKDGKKDRFAKSVQHPGTDPMPWIRETLRIDLPKIIQANLQRTFK